MEKGSTSEFPSSKTKPTANEQSKSEELPSKVANSKRGASAQKSAPRGGAREKAPRTRSQNYSRPHPHDNTRRDNKSHPPREGRVHSSRDKPRPADFPGQVNQGAAEVSKPLDPSTDLDKK